MAKFLLLALILFSGSAFGQEKPNFLDRKSPSPSIPVNPENTMLRVIYPTKNSDPHSKKPAYYLNGGFVNEAAIFSLNPKDIESMDIEKENVVINNITYYGKILLTTKRSHNTKLITLNALKAKYLKANKLPTIIFLDGELVTSDYDDYEVDENFLLRVIIDEIENKKEGIKLNRIKLLTKSEENIKKVNEIRIRGTEMSLNR